MHNLNIYWEFNVGTVRKVAFYKTRTDNFFLPYLCAAYFEK
jgi:hypothetical protein